ncbi:hypothetical protein AVEN_124808-1 [Araneus ventricosus]|uniref:Uncharacterized protein n=1 Tax=Araneus ventricosus TaxID=182803 RepID=A0A4Y2PW14_ARAVE|nr:hypothetical protein AVEN_99623-1 [Araneus ventricosus]GBN54760.1 hypothetical protein AVEN_124808-1 [Araneus ventricosus]
MDQHSYRSAPNSLIARTADRTPETFALQGDPSRPTHLSSSKCSPYIVSPGRPWRHMESSSTFERIFSPNRDIGEDSSTFEIPYRSGVQTWLRHLIFTPVKLSSQP